MSEFAGSEHESDHIPGGIPRVSPEIITAFRAEPHDFDALFNRIRDTNPQLARYIMARAVELDQDLTAREHSVRLTIEALGIVSSQAEAEQFEQLFNATSKKPDPPAAA